MSYNGNRVNNMLMEPRPLLAKQKLSMMFSRQNSDLPSSKKVVKKKGGGKADVQMPKKD